MKRAIKPVAAAACAAAAAALYCSRSIQTEDWQVPSPRLPAAFDGFRITLVTDVHGAVCGPDNCSLLAAVRKSRPDLIAVCGDLFDQLCDRGEMFRLLKRLLRLAPVFFVPGNHEWYLPDTDRLLEQIQKTGARVLRNEALALHRGKEQILLAGCDDPFTEYPWESPQAVLARIRRQFPGDPYLVMLYHRNNSLHLWDTLRADVVLAGHGHGGVVRLPLVGGLFSVERTLFPKDCEGLYRAGRTTLAVSRGVGGLRLWNRPHVPTVVLKQEVQP